MTFQEFGRRVSEIVQREVSNAQVFIGLECIRWRVQTNAAQLSDCFGLAVVTLHVNGKPAEAIEFRIDTAEIDTAAKSVCAFFGEAA